MWNNYWRSLDALLAVKKEYKLNYGESLILLVLYHNVYETKQLNQTMIASIIDSGKSDVSRWLMTLESKRMIKRTAISRRENVINITVKGQDLISRILDGNEIIKKEK